MVGSKTFNDAAKKRKREGAERVQRAKRARAEGNGAQLNGLTEPLVPSAVVETNGDVQNGLDADENAGWQISKPVGGRMLDIDPILTNDEQHLIIAYNTSIQVYSASDSLLIRRIPIITSRAGAQPESSPSSIVSVRLSRQDPEQLWVACSDGRIYHVGWKSEGQAVEKFTTTSGTARAMTTRLARISNADQEVILVLEAQHDPRVDLVAYDGSPATSLKPARVMTVAENLDGLQIIESSEDGQIIVGASNDKLFLGVASEKEVTTLKQLRYEFFSWQAPDIVSALDMRFLPAKSTGAGRRGPGMVDLIIGCARGPIYRYNDALSKLQASGGSSAGKRSLQGQKYHWHRKAVHAVKWSRDGHYMISGGSENTLVVWQMDTMKQTYLPHLSASIENIVVSPSGSSYVVHLDDNSTMMLSTAEMLPSAYVSGIQSATSNTSTPKDFLVRRTWATLDHVSKPIPAAIRPLDSTKIHICVGSGRQATLAGELSAPLLQSLDLESFTNASRQPLARTQPTDRNLTSRGVPVDEPLVTNIAYSSDGGWLASVDVWQPSPKDIGIEGEDYGNTFTRDRRETYLKFWEVGKETDSVALVSRVNDPHYTLHPDLILGLASDPTSSRFATLGEDGIVRMWRPRSRHENGMVVKSRSGKEEISWGCTAAISLDVCLSEDVSLEASVTSAPETPCGDVTFSEDGSTMFAAFGLSNGGLVYVIDATTGSIVRTLEGMWTGRCLSIKALASYVILLSDELNVYDVVADELRFGVAINHTAGLSNLAQLAVDYVSGHFAVTFPIGGVSNIGIFDPDDPEPVLVSTLPQRVVSLVSSPDSSGFIAVDDAAQVWTLAEGSEPLSLAAAQPLEDLRLDIDPTTSVAVDEDAEMQQRDAEEDDQDVPDVDMDMDMDGDEGQESVLPQQYLSQIFDATPAYAAPSIEDMFDRVTSLLGSKPLSASKA